MGRMCHEYPTGFVSMFAVPRYRLSTASAYSIYELFPVSGFVCIILHLFLAATQHLLGIAALESL